MIVAASAVVYLPSLDGGFIWDDESLISSNRLIQSSGGLYDIWLTTKAVDYWPLTNSSFWIEWRLWGQKPAGYHVINLVLHVGNALLIWMILAKLGIPGGWLAALLFAIHPVNVESVAWIAQRKNTLSMLFFLVSILCYLKDEGARSESARAGGHPLPGPILEGEEGGAGRWYWLSLAAFLLAMLSKGSVATLPLVLLGIVWWERGRIQSNDLLRSVPFFAVAVIFTLVNIWFQRHGNSETIREVTLLERIVGAPAVVWFYLYKAVWPLNLAFVYPQWNIRASAPIWWFSLLAAVVMTAVLIWKHGTSWGRSLLAAWAFFVVALLPVLGLTDIQFMRYSLVADHYQYVAIVAVTAIAGAAWSTWYRRSSGAGRRVAVAVMVLVAGSWVFLSRQESKLYADATTLYQAALLKNPSAAILHSNLGLRYMQEGNRERAIQHYLAALAIEPDAPEAHYYLGCALSDEGKNEEAIEHFRASLRSKPHAHIENNLASALIATGNLTEAIEHLERAIKIEPDFVVAHFNLGNALLDTGRLGDALPYFEAAIRLEPNWIEAYASLADTQARLNRPQLAIAAAEKGIAAARGSNQIKIGNELQAWLDAYRAALQRGQSGASGNAPASPTTP